MALKIFKTWVHLHGKGPAGMCIVDTIVYEDKLWLVPEWLDIRGLGVSMPVRIVRLDGLEYEPDPGAGCDYVLRHSMPTSVFYGRIPPPPDSPYCVIEHPNIQFPCGGHYPFGQNP
jgi:hypothetical protein